MCVFIAALIHYFYLAGFAWMLFEGVYLYLMVVRVFNTVIKMRLFYAVAWGKCYALKYNLDSNITLTFYRYFLGEFFFAISYNLTLQL